MQYRTFKVERRGHNLWITLNRPDVHNAFNDELIGEAITLFDWIAGKKELRAAVLTGSGPIFCAGADVNWMAKTVHYSREENIRDASRMAKMLAVMNECPIPLIGRIQGAAIGGGVGLAAVCDIVAATAATKFGLAEVKLGIMPAAISPYVIAKIGETHARALFLTGERFDAERALQIGLIHRIAADETELDAIVAEILTQLASSGPEAVRECKKLIALVASSSKVEAIPYTIEAISTRRVSPEGQAGLNAFLSKQKAPWAGG